MYENNKRSILGTAKRSARRNAIVFLMVVFIIIYTTFFKKRNVIINVINSKNRYFKSKK